MKTQLLEQTMLHIHLKIKKSGVWSSSPGIPGLETVVSLLLTQVNKGNLDLKLIPKNIIQKCC